MTGDPEDNSPEDERVICPSRNETLQLLSHDIRSAMSDVIGGLRLIDLARLDAETRLQFDRVQAAGDTLAGLVDAALMTAAGDAPVQQTSDRVDVRAWLLAQSDRWQGRATERGGAFLLHTEGDLPQRVRMPRVVLDRIIGNLIGNALAHVQGGAVRLTVEKAQGGGLQIAVCDDGPGYPDAVLDSVNRHGQSAPMGQGAGSGLGLRIVAELTRDVGGTLTLENRASGGCALLHLPESLLDWGHATQTPAAPPDLDGMRILVAEDNLTNQTILRQLLERMNAAPLIVADGVAALEALARHPFDLALIDIEMPRLSGLDVLRRARARDDAVSQMPMVALTAYVLRDNREAIYAAGADGIIGKPISSAAEFGQAILRLAGRAPLAELPRSGSLSGGAEHDRMDHARFDSLMEVAGAEGRDELLQRLGEDLEATRAALDLAVAGSDLSEVRAQTHILIAISGAVGADGLHDLAEVLNIAAKRKRDDDLAALYAPCRRALEALISFVAGYAGRGR